jgi:hypothetical protein
LLSPFLLFPSAGFAARRRASVTTFARFASGGERALRGKVRTLLNAPERLALAHATPTRPITSGWRDRTRLALLALACFELCGCASLWDDVTSRDFEFRSLWVKPDPLVVLRDSKDGDKRAKALRMLHEPAQFGEPPEQQDTYVRVLCTAAATERTALCRQAAIATLRTYKDARVYKGQKETKPGQNDGYPGLEDAYYRASDFAPETAAILRCQVLEAVGQVGNPDAVPFLLTIVNDLPVKGAERDKQQILEERIAAARALGHFKNLQAADTLLGILQKEKDPGMRNVATMALQMETGKRFPEDAVAWEQYLHSKTDKEPIFGEPSFTDQIWDIVNVGWWK